ncbi:Spy/CpxP family protein refolding chaperone [Vibrio sp. ED004]|uniref:Spy/CpxP family protein refolding chaperone n=1 Tax=unclassified Vibrio TaxID=2614977 RepID=UPI0003794C4F|nr:MULTISPECIES: Spy/CpxP family protein refolding chaperone [unclassified Vibrio]UPR59781.1 Spy/CpxP family protein refolding chaperone [Vibrio sp. ED004]
MKLLKRSFCALSASALLMAPLAFASNTQHSMPALNPIQMVIASMDLTAEQQAEIFRLVDEYQSNRSPADIDRALEVKRQQIRIVTQPDFDESELEAIIDSVQAEEKAIAMDDMRLKNKIYNVLTNEQKNRFKASMKFMLNGY